MIRMLDIDDFARLRPEQKQALDWTRSIAVRANAGSGKTSVLTQRIVQILHHHRDDLRLDQIVAITFTRKAAAELRHRLRTTIDRCAAAAGADASFWQAR